MAGPASAAARSREFEPLPGLKAAGEADLESGEIGDLHALYGGLGSGRLIIAGNPGSGKSSAAVVLVLAALRHREAVSAAERKLVPVPILLTIQGWDPNRQKVKDWLVGELQATYQLFAGARGAEVAVALLDAGRISVILDGLDEIDPDLRPAVLRALNQQATFRLTLLSRTTEMASAADSGILQGAAAIELNPVDASSAADYLERIQRDPPPPAWRELTERIRTDPDSPLSLAMGTPLALTLVRDTYRAEDDVRELLDFCGARRDGGSASETADAITDHLLDRVLPAAYADRPGQALPYDLRTAERSFTRIAAQMNRVGTRDLNWWQILEWVPSVPRRIVAILTVGLVVGLVVGFAYGPVVGPLLGLVFGIQGGSAAAIAAAITGGSLKRPVVISDIRLKKVLAPKNLVVGLVVGSVVGIASGIALGAASGVVPGVALGLASGVVYGLETGLSSGLSSGAVSGFVLGFVLSKNAAFPVWLASVQMARKWRTPVRLMDFLDDAYRRNVLRAVGPTYQFRHARLQDRLAGQDRARAVGGVPGRYRRNGPWKRSSKRF